jgi:hypothetical protein
MRTRVERGFVLLAMTFFSIALLGVLGVAVDVGRVFVAKTESQTFCDAAALAATLQLDGTTGGIAAAKNAVSNSANRWNMDTVRISNYQVDFATSSTGPWSSNPNPAVGFIYSRVQLALPVDLYFIPVVVSQRIQDVNSIAIAGQIAQTAVPRGLGPFTAVSTNPTDPNYGLVVGDQYDIQWPAYNGSRAGCSPSTPDNCFVKPACGGESGASKTAVTQYWGASINGYWGSNANSTIDQEVLDLIQLQPLSLNQAITLTSGNKNAEATALDTRVNQDTNVADNEPDDYQNSSNHNNRRLIGLPVVNPTASGTFVIGYAAFLLLSNADVGHGTASTYYASGNGNDPFCAVYAGGYKLDGSGPGGSGTAGYFLVKLVQ